MKKLLINFAAGCLGALANSLTAWALGKYGLTKAMGVAIVPALSPGWLYPRIVWGGLWGLLFILPLSDAKSVRKGMMLSLVPTAVQLLMIYPHAGKGMAGLALGLLTPLFVLLLNGVWGITTALTIKYAR